MWLAAKIGGRELSVPSMGEINDNFSRTATQITDGAYGFFVDGLDKFSGNYRDGISFLSKLATFPDIKVPVSSPPIDVCVDAFSSRLKLALQDLAKKNIRGYVKDTN